MVLFGKSSPLGTCKDVYQAAAEGNFEAVRYFIDALHTYKVNSRNDRNQTLVHLSAARGHLSIVKWCMARQENSFITAEDDEGNSIMHAAVSSNSFPMVQYVASKNDTFLRRHLNNKGDSILHTAARYGNMDVIKFFTRVWEMPHVLQNLAGETVAHVAARYNQSEALGWFIDGYTQYAWMKDNDNNLPLHWAAANGNALFVDKFCRKYKVDADVFNRNGQFPIHLAASNRANVNTTVFLVEGCNASPKVTQRITPWYSAIHVAAAHGNMAALWYFSKKFGDIYELKNDINQTVILAAAIGDQLDAVKFLMTFGANVFAQDSRGNTILHYAAQHRNLGIVKYVLDAMRTPLRLDAINWFGWTSVYIATQYHNLPFLQYVVDTKGGRYILDIPSSNGRTPLMEAVIRDNFTMVEYLALNSRSIGWSDNHGKMAIDFAVSEKVKTFLQARLLEGSTLRPVTRVTRMVPTDSTLVAQSSASTQSDFTASSHRRDEFVSQDYGNFWLLLGFVWTKFFGGSKAKNGSRSSELPPLEPSPQQRVLQRIDPIAIDAIYGGRFGEDEDEFLVK